MSKATLVPVQPINDCGDSARVSLSVTPAEIKLRALGRIERAVGDALAEALVGRWMLDGDGDAVYEPSQAEFAYGNAADPLEEFVIEVAFTAHVRPKSVLPAPRLMIEAAQFDDPFADE